jgi:tripartite-type tricarboxylate transporter receptor subunit TctC
MKEAMSSPSVKAKMEGQGFVVPPQGSKVYADFVGKEVDRWTNVIKTAGIKTQ